MRIKTIVPWAHDDYDVIMNKLYLYLRVCDINNTSNKSSFKKSFILKLKILCTAQTPFEISIIKVS